MTRKLKLRAEDHEDLAVISAVLQDARVSLREMMFDPGERRFMAAFARYMRELQEDPCSCEGLLEIPSALTFEEVEKVLYRNLDPGEPERELVLLTIATEPGRDHLLHIHLVFAGGAEIQLRTDRIVCRLEDFGESCPCRVNPCDHFAESA